MEIGNGLAAQANAAIGYRLSKSMAIMATTGRINALQGNFKANVAGLALAYQFTGFVAK